MPLPNFFSHIPQLTRETPSDQRKPKFCIGERAVCLRGPRPDRRPAGRVASRGYRASMQGPWARKRARVSGQGVALSWPEQPTPPQRERDPANGFPLCSATRPYAS